MKRSCSRESNKQFENAEPLPGLMYLNIPIQEDAQTNFFILSNYGY